MNGERLNKLNTMNYLEISFIHCHPPSAIFRQLYHGENKLIFNEMMIMSALY